MDKIIKIFADDILDDISSEITLDNRITGVKYSMKTAERKHMTLAECAFGNLSKDTTVNKTNYTIPIDKPWYVDYEFKLGDFVIEKIASGDNGNDITEKTELIQTGNDKWAKDADSITIVQKNADNIIANIKVVAKDKENNYSKEIKVKISGDALEIKDTNVTLGNVDNLYEMPCNLLKSGALLKSGTSAKDLCAKDAQALIDNNKYGKQTISLSVPVRSEQGETGEEYLDAGALDMGDVVQVFKCRRSEYESDKPDAYAVAVDRYGKVKNFIITKIESIYGGEYIKNLELKEVYDE